VSCTLLIVGSAITRDPDVGNDISAVRHLRVEVVLVPWLALTAALLGLLISFWRV
jgi:hypothetical protein